MASEEASDQKSLSDSFDEGLAILNSLESSNEDSKSTDFQVKVKRGIRLLEEATRMVSEIGLFSPNESIEEVSTNDIKYLLLPALLGILVSKLCDRNLEIINISEVYFRDFLERCNNYGVTNLKIPQRQTESSSSECNGAPSAPSLEQMACTRNNKIKKLQEKKKLEEELKTLQIEVKKGTVDDEIKRKYFLNLIKTHANSAIEELESIAFEKPMAEMRAKMQTEKKPNPRQVRPPPAPLKAVIITRSELQKQVFGAGYPSLPVMTVEEFYDKRVRDGVFPDAAQCAARSLQDMANTENKEELEEEEAARKEELVEKDNPEELERARKMDEFKDDHRRGEGNRYNRS